jgi:hypothetical protein
MYPVSKKASILSWLLIFHKTAVLFYIPFKYLHWQFQFLYKLQSLVSFTVYVVFKTFQNCLWYFNSSSEPFLTVEFLWLQVNHYSGLFCEYYHDYEKALICYEGATCGANINFPAEMSYLNLKMRMSFQESYSPIFYLDKLVFKYSSPNYIVQILCHRGFYLYM